MSKDQELPSYILPAATAAGAAALAIIGFQYAQGKKTGNHLPRTDEELAQLTLQEKVMMSAVTASGGDAVAYYTPDNHDKLTLRQQIDLYDLDPKHPHAKKFTDTLDGYKHDTYASEEKVRENPEYHFPVYDKKGQVKGVMVIHAPQDGYIRVQTAEEADMNAKQPQDPRIPKPDAHEPAAVRIAKLHMAQHIVAMNQQHLPERDEKSKAIKGDAGTPEEKHAFLLQMAKDMFSTFPKKEAIPPAEYAAVEQAQNGEELRLALRKTLRHERSAQGSHLVGTADLMKYAADALNNDAKKPVLSQDQSATVELLAMLHDVGKAQFSSVFWEDWKTRGKLTPEEQKEQDARNVDFVGRNGNHAFLTEAMLQLYPASAKTIGDHHHGHDRYSEPELDKDLGNQKEHSIIAKDHVPEKKVSTLSRMIRVADVAESITAASVDKPLHIALQQMAEKAGAEFNTRPAIDPATGKPLMAKDAKTSKETPVMIKTTIKSFHKKNMDPNTIDADALAFMIDNDVFKAYGKQRAQEENGWLVKKADPANELVPGMPKYDEKALEEVKKDILKNLGWTPKHKKEVEEKIRAAIGNDALFADKPAHGHAPPPARHAPKRLLAQR